MPHPDEGLIHAWLDGELDAAEAARVEALVNSDAEWAAAAAEARGLIAASARIVGNLDRVPANVIPKAPATRPASRRWVWRAAAALALMAGSAVVLERESPVLPSPRVDVAALPAKAAAPAPAPIDSPVRAIAAPMAKHEPSVAAKTAIAKKDNEPKERLADTKAAEQAPAQPARDKDAANPLSELQGRVTGANVVSAGAGTELRAANARAAAAAQASPAAAPPSQPASAQKFTRLQPSCFEEHEPLDSSAHIVIRLSAAALADSIRLESLVLRGDTLSAVNGRFRAVRVPCPAP